MSIYIKLSYICTFVLLLRVYEIWKKLQRSDVQLSERLASVGNHGGLIEDTPWKPSNIIALWYWDGKGAPHYARGRKFLGLSMWLFRTLAYALFRQSLYHLYYTRGILASFGHGDVEETKADRWRVGGVLAFFLGQGGQRRLKALWRYDFESVETWRVFLVSFILWQGSQRRWK